MRVLMVSTSYPVDLGDWRGLFIRHLTDALARRDDMVLQTWCPPGEMPANVKWIASEPEAQWLQRLMAAGGIAHLIRSGGVRGLTHPFQLLAHLRRMYRRENRISLRHINWLQNTLALPRDKIPVLSTVLGTDMQLLHIPGMTTLLRRTFRTRRTVICPNADWMLPDLQRRFGDIAEIRLIPFGIDPCWFNLRRAPVQPQRWICVTRITCGKIGKLFEWAEPHFRDSQRELHLFGPMQEKMELPPWVINHGPATPASLCAEWFPQAQGLITLSQHAEGRPQVMLEAMASGLPIIASAIPAHTDLLEHGRTGWLCADRTDFAEGLDQLSDPAANVALGQSAREWVADEVGTWDDCAARYVSTYRDLCFGDST